MVSRSSNMPTSFKTYCKLQICILVVSLHVAPSWAALPLLGFSPQIWGFPTRSRVLGFVLGDLGFFLGFFKKSRAFLGFCQISPKNTYFAVFFAGKHSFIHYGNLAPLQGYYSEALPTALSHSLPDYRHTNCIHSLIGRFYTNEYSCTLTSLLSCW